MFSNLLQEKETSSQQRVITSHNREQAEAIQKELKMEKENLILKEEAIQKELRECVSSIQEKDCEIARLTTEASETRERLNQMESETRERLGREKVDTETGIEKENLILKDEVDGEKGIEKVKT